MPREIEQILRVAERLAGCLRNPCDSDLVIHTLANIICFHLLIIGAGYADGYDASALSNDPIFKMVQSVTPSPSASLPPNRRSRALESRQKPRPRSKRHRPMARRGAIANSLTARRAGAAPSPEWKPDPTKLTPAAGAADVARVLRSRQTNSALMSPLRVEDLMSPSCESPS